MAGDGGLFMGEAHELRAHPGRDPDGSRPPGPESPFRKAQRIWSVPEGWLIGCHGLCLLAWPLFAFAIGFVYDAPLHGESDRLGRNMMVASIWIYPLLLGGALALSLLLKYLGAPVAARVATTLLPWIVPVAGLALGNREIHKRPPPEPGTYSRYADPADMAPVGRVPVRPHAPPEE